MVLRVSDLGPSNDDHDKKIGYNSVKRHLHPETEGVFSPNELERKKKLKKENSETEADSSSSDHSCFVALVTASNLHNDALELPKDFTTSNGVKRGCSEIVLTDKGKRAWSLDLRFNESSETFYITRGWRCFCKENGKKAGGFFIFNLVGDGEIPVLSFCPKESRQRECSEAIQRESLSTQLSSSSGEENMEEKNSEDDDYSSMEMERVTLKITPCSVQKCRLLLPLNFTRENGINKPGIITLQGKDGIKHHTKLLLLGKGRGNMVLGSGWKEFAKANGLKTGDSFTLKLIWEDTTPVLSLSSVKKARKKDSLPIEASEEERKKDRLRCRDSTSPSQNRFVTLTPTHISFIKGRQYLPLLFVSDNGMTRPGVITLVGKDGTKWLVSLSRNGIRKIYLGKGWKEFGKANGLKVGQSFTLELISENETRMLRLLSKESTMQQGECSKEASSENKTRKANNNREEMRDDSSSPIQNRFVTLKLTTEDTRACILHLPSRFMRANGINKLGKITLLGENETKWFGYLLTKDGIVSMGSGWKRFCEANGVKIGESFTLELISEQGTNNFVFNFCSNS